MEGHASCVANKVPDQLPSMTSTVIAVCGCGNDGRLGIGIGTIRMVRVGGYHNFVVTTEGVYGWGLNEDGQLGLGRGSPSRVSVPTRVPFFNGKTVKDIACGAYHTFAWTDNGLYACGKNEDGQLGLPSGDGIFSFTLVLTAVQTNGDDVHGVSLGGETSGAGGACRLMMKGQLTHISCGTHHTLLALRDVTTAASAADSKTQFTTHSLLILAAGKGDFGELGYNGDAWSILQAKARTMHSALQDAARRTQQRDFGSPEATVAVDNYSKQWKPTKQRRATFSSDRFEPVAVQVALEQPDAQYGSTHFEVVDLQAMHLHSAVTLRRVSPLDDGDQNDSRIRTFHWGCYYCNEVEDDDSSVPREETGAVALHAGNEILFRYHKASKGSLEIHVVGSGVIGLGEEDSFSKTWVPLSLPPDVGPVSGVRNIVGREHFLIQLDDSVVVGFGDNIHGQLGAGKQKDSLLLPIVVLRTGSVLMCPSGVSNVDLTVRWKVERIAGVFCGMRHSLFVLEVSSFIVNTFSNASWRKWKNVDPATLC